MTEMESSWKSVGTLDAEVADEVTLEVAELGTVNGANETLL